MSKRFFGFLVVILVAACQPVAKAPVHLIVAQEGPKIPVVQAVPAPVPQAQVVEVVEAQVTDDGQMLWVTREETVIPEVVPPEAGNVSVAADPKAIETSVSTELPEANDYTRNTAVEAWTTASQGQNAVTDTSLPEVVETPPVGPQIEAETEASPSGVVQNTHVSATEWWGSSRDPVASEEPKVEEPVEDEPEEPEVAEEPKVAFPISEKSQIANSEVVPILKTLDSTGPRATGTGFSVLGRNFLVNQERIEQTEQAEQEKKAENPVKPPKAWEISHIWKVVAGETLVDTLQEWSDQVGWQFVIETDRNWTFRAGTSFEGTYLEAVSELFRVMQRSKPSPPKGFAFVKNLVMILSDDLGRTE